MSRLANLTIGLFGIIMLLVAFKQVDFFLLNDAGVFIVKIWIPVAMVITVCFMGKAIGWKWQWCMAFLVVAELMIFCAFEIAARRVEIPSPFLNFLRLMYADKCRNIAQFDAVCSQYDERLFYKLKPGRSRFCNIEFQTELDVNTAGFRDDDSSLYEPDIAFFGDSFTMGWGVNQDETYCDILEKQLLKKCLNLGVPSYGTAREFLVTKDIDLKKTQLLVLQYGPFDEGENRVFVENNFLLPVSPKSVMFRHNQWNDAWATYFPLKYAYVAFFNLAGMVKHWLTGREIFPAIKTELTGVELADFFAILGRLRQGFAGNIVLINFCQRAYPSQVSQQFSHWLETHPMQNVTVLNLENKLTQADYFILDDHIHAGGHAKVARLLQAFIEENQLLAPN